MGCLISKKTSLFKNNESHQSSQKITETMKQYSWSNRDQKLSFNYVIENELNSLKIRMPGEINGEQMIIQNCDSCTIGLFDFSNTLIIDDCKNCSFFIGPVSGSVIIRNCQDCNIMSASQQFRTRDCLRLKCFLFCTTQPAIESCQDILIGCFTANYNLIEEHFSKANLNVFNNNWFHVYDFSLDTRETHWTPFYSTEVDKSFLSFLKNENLNLCFDLTNSFVPQTLGITSFDMQNSKNLVKNQMWLVFVYCNLPTLEKIIFQNKVKSIINEMNLHFKELSLMITKHVKPEKTSVIIDKFHKSKTFLKFDEITEPTKLNQLIVLLYYQNDFSMKNSNQKMKNVCQQCLEKKKSETNFYIISRNEDEIQFFECLSLVFESLF